MIHLAGGMVILVMTHIFCIAAMSERKYSVRKTALIYAVFGFYFIVLTLVVFALFGSNSADTAFISFTSTIFAAFFLFILTSTDAFCKKLFLFISHSNLFCIFFCIAILVCNGLFPSLSESGAMYARNMVRTILYLLAILIYLKFLRPYVRAVPGTKKKTWYSIALVSLLFLAVFTSFVVFLYAGYGHAGETIFFFAAVVLIYCSVLWVIFRTIQHIDYEAKTELISKNVEYLQGQLALAKENELTARTIRHDFRHHNQIVAALLQKGDIKEAQRYIEQYDESLEAAKPERFCPNTTVNAILSNFYIKARKDGISVSISADTPGEASIEDMDFVAILSNILENALNGCRESGVDGEICVDIRSVANKVVIVCSNPCKAGLEIENGMLRKRSTGIDSIVLAAGKYDGDIRYELESGYLTVCVILNT